MYTESNQSQNTYTKQANFSAQTPQHCANCEIEFLWPPTIVQGTIYCCTGCAAGGPCSCDYSQYSSVNISGVIHYGSEMCNGHHILDVEQSEE